MQHYPTTPDGRYFVVNGRLWRCQNPNLSDKDAKKYKSDLGVARAAVKNTKKDTPERKAAREAVNKAKVSLGERGPVWWTDGAPDVNRKAPKNTLYATWWQSIKNDITEGTNE